MDTWFRAAYKKEGVRPSGQRSTETHLEQILESAVVGRKVQHIVLDFAGLPGYSPGVRWSYFTIFLHSC